MNSLGRSSGGEACGFKSWWSPLCWWLLRRTEGNQKLSSKRLEFKTRSLPQYYATCFKTEPANTKSGQSCPALCDPVDCSPPGSSVRGILQATILQWVAISFSRGSSQPGDWNWVSCITRQILHRLNHKGSTHTNLTCTRKRDKNSNLKEAWTRPTGLSRYRPLTHFSKIYLCYCQYSPNAIKVHYFAQSKGRWCF